MTHPPRLALHAPAAHAARLVALRLLDESRDAAHGLRRGDEGDADPLHDFRVATRRLRSWLQLWRATLNGSIRGRDRRRVRRIARATGPARDLDVHRAWLVRQRDAAPPREHEMLEAAIARIDARRGEALAEAREAAARLERRHARLERRLARYRVDVRDADSGESFGVALAAIARDADEAFAASLAAVRSPRDDEAIHLARIAAKRLRYVLEPIAALDPAAPHAIGELKAFQDLAGTLHDLHVFGVADGEMPPAIARRIVAQRRDAFAALERDWLRGAAAPFRDRVRRIADRCARAADPTLAGPDAAPPVG